MTSSQDTSKVLKMMRENGWELLRHGHDHDVWVGPNGTRFPVARHRQMSPGVYRKLLKAMKEDEEK